MTHLRNDILLCLPVPTGAYWFVRERSRQELSCECHRGCLCRLIVSTCS